jgi:fucose permease
MLSRRSIGSAVVVVGASAAGLASASVGGIVEDTLDLLFVGVPLALFVVVGIYHLVRKRRRLGPATHRVDGDEGAT